MTSLRFNRRTPADAEDALPGTLHPVLRRVYLARGITSPRELELGLDRLHSPELLKGIGEAVDLLCGMRESQRRLLIVADFDADGATSCAVAVRGLRLLGFQHVDYLVPIRFEHGYGLTPDIVDIAAQRHPDLIITVDNGISSLEGVARANALGIQVLVTDHHLPGPELPAAAAIVNPNQPGDDFPSKHLAGVGVIFYLLLALRRRLRESGGFARGGIEEPNLAALLDLVALGTVADVVPLDHNNRILVEQGLRRIRAGKCCAGIAALLQVAKRDARHVVASDLGFAVGPRLNAAGRLTEMGRGVECLLSDRPAKALAMACELDTLNRERRRIEAEMQAEASLDLAGLEVEPEAVLPAALVLHRSGWHQGVIGILASRIKARYHRPVIVFADGGNGVLKGSARSIAGVHIRDVLERVAVQNAGLILRFGGHAMAAGLTLAAERLEEFEIALCAEVARVAGDELGCGHIVTDGALRADDLALDLARQLQSAGPWGQGFPEPVFDGRFRIASHRVLGGEHLKLTLCPEDDEQRCIDAIAFRQAGVLDTLRSDRLCIAYRLEVNRYRGESRPQLVVEAIREASTVP